MTSSREFVKLLRHFPVKKSSKEDIESIWSNVSENPNVTLKLVLAYPDKPWDWSALSCRLPWADVIAKPYLRWDWNILIARRDVTSEIIKKFPNRKKGDIKLCSRWHYKKLCKRANILDLIREDPKRGHWQALSDNDHVTLKFVEEFIDKPWDWKQLSSHACITFEFVKAHPNKPWSWEKISGNDKISLQDIVKHPRCVWGLDCG